MLENTHSWAGICENFLEQWKHKFKTPEQRRKFSKWFAEREKVGYLFDNTMIYRVWKIANWLNTERDHFIVISGGEGSGKSTLATQIGSWLSPNGFSIIDMCYTSQQYLTRMSEKTRKILSTEDRNSIPQDVLVLDEAGTQLLSRQSLSSSNVSLTKSFFAQRALKFLIILCVPNFFFLDTVIREHRVKSLIHITKRGTYKLITGKGIKTVSEFGKKTKQISKVTLGLSDFIYGNFSKKFPKTVDKEQYEIQKLEAIDELLTGLKDDFVEQKLFPASKVAKELGITTNTLINHIQNRQIQGKQINARWYISREAYNKLISLEN